MEVQMRDAERYLSDISWKCNTRLLDKAVENGGEIAKQLGAQGKPRTFKHRTIAEAKGRAGSIRSRFADVCFAQVPRCPILNLQAGRVTRVGC